MRISGNGLEMRSCNVHFQETGVQEGPKRLGTRIERTLCAVLTTGQVIDKRKNVHTLDTDS